MYTKPQPQIIRWKYPSPSFWRHHKNIFLYHLLFPGISTQTQQQIRLRKGRKKSLFSLWFSSCTNYLVALSVLLCRHHYQPHTQAFTFYNHNQQKGRLYVLLITNMIFVWQETTAPSGVVNAIHTPFFWLYAPPASSSLSFLYCIEQSRVPSIFADLSPAGFPHSLICGPRWFILEIGQGSNLNTSNTCY